MRVRAVAIAVAHAREASERGNFDAMLEIGPQLQASQADAAGRLA
jgi:hypothetical protein